MGTDRKQNLETLAMFASWPISAALEATYTRFAADAFFTKYRMDWFATNPTNCMPYSALRALEGESVVRLAELLKDEHNLHPIDAEIVGKHKLALHRDMISHPWTVRWRRPNRQQFDDDGHKFSDVRSGLVWSVAKDFDEALEREGIDRRLAVIPATPAMAEMLNLILRLTVKPGVAMPSASDLLVYLQIQTSGVMAVLERFPDGTNAREPDDADE